ncbi:MAG: hypothetical protein V3T86_00490 [Planctomycetota bacterium]
MDPRLKQKIDETLAVARRRRVDLRSGPLLCCFEQPLWGGVMTGREVHELVSHPGTSVAVVSPDPLPVVQRAVERAPRIHVVAERGLVCRLSGGATHHVYQGAPNELAAFATGLFAGAAPEGLCVALAPFVSPGRQEVDFGGETERGTPVTELALAHAISHFGCEGQVSDAGVLVRDEPAALEAVRCAMAHEFPGRSFRVNRLATGHFRFAHVQTAESRDRDQIRATAQGIAMSCDRWLEMHGGTRYGFTTAPVAGYEVGPESGALHLAEAVFGSPNATVTHLGQQPFLRPGTLFFAYEGSNTILEARNERVPCVTVHDIVEYVRILLAIREGV